MVKSGLIFGGIALVVALGVTLIMPYCVPCLALLLGLAAGYVAGIFGKPADQPTATRSGAIAGALGGAGVVLGEMIGAIINGLTVGSERVNEIIQNLGLAGGISLTPATYWASQLGINLCLSLFSVGLMAGLGALGGLLWWKTRGTTQTSFPPTFPIQ
jgi:hypothetical protein